MASGCHETLNRLDMDEHTKDNFLLLGASMTLLSCDILLDDPAHINPAAPQPHSNTNYDRAADEPRAADQYFSESNIEFAHDELHHTEYWIGQAQQAARTDAEKNQVRDLYAWLRLLQQKS